MNYVGSNDIFDFIYEMAFRDATMRMALPKSDE